MQGPKDIFRLELRLNVRHRSALIPWVVVVGLILGSSGLWEFLKRILAGVG